MAADTKVGMLLTANGFALTGLISASRARKTVAVYTVATALEVVLLVCMVYLAATLWPSLRGAGAGNWFSFPTFPSEIDRRPTESVLADHAWRQAAVLAGIARRKYRRFGIALRWSAVSLVVFLIWFTLSLLSER
ncbi:Pycsar system effector family protein [Nocardia sp. NPDC050630]|uniref:Pycsar system effector family protein n=1 Tax=Nocardia sp. NPDC050630 TaxID=3364321 RepID=UPI0037AE8319